VGAHRQQGSAGLTLPGSGISAVTAMAWEAVLTAGLVSVILGTASGAQQVGPLAAIGVGSYIVLAGLWAAPVSGASMNPARSLGPALVLDDWTGGRTWPGLFWAASSPSALPMSCAGRAGA
jgi:aquaporin Z